MNPRMWVATAPLLLAALGCRDDTTAPTQAVPTTPRASVAAATALTFSQLSAGGDHTCGVTTEARAYCWGWGFYGQLGIGTTPWNDSIPSAVLGGLSFRHVSAGGLHTCGVTTDYRAYCWGNNGYAGGADGALGDGTKGNTRLTPVAVAGAHRFRQVTTGAGHSCAVTPTNVGFCWGYNSAGQLGDGSTTDRLIPVRVGGGLLWKQLSAGLYHTCGVTIENRAYCWGADYAGQLGDGSGATPRLRPRLVAGGHLFTQVDAGDVHTCAVTTSGQAFCWGANSFGQLGDGTTTFRFAPRAVAGGLAFSRVSAGDQHTCGEVSHRAYCWGRNQVGQDGSGGAGLPRLKPTAVKGGLFFGQVTAGFEHTCGKTTASVAYCWGGNNHGKLGDGTLANRVIPTLVVSPQ
jgi:alpha-tubulin suppressor-like RCC1 family protein